MPIGFIAQFSFSFSFSFSLSCSYWFAQFSLTHCISNAIISDNLRNLNVMNGPDCLKLQPFVALFFSCPCILATLFLFVSLHLSLGAKESFDIDLPKRCPCSASVSVSSFDILCPVILRRWQLNRDIVVWRVLGPKMCRVMLGQPQQRLGCARTSLRFTWQDWGLWEVTTSFF